MRRLVYKENRRFGLCRTYLELFILGGVLEKKEEISMIVGARILDPSRRLDRPNEPQPLVVWVGLDVQGLVGIWGYFGSHPNRVHVHVQVGPPFPWAWQPVLPSRSSPVSYSTPFRMSIEGRAVRWRRQDKQQSVLKPIA